jgi:hypothetical protein
MLAAELLSPDHGDTIVRPTPDPSRRRIRVTPMAANDPPNMGPHDMADFDDSTGISSRVSEMDMIAILIARTERGG